MLENRNNAQGLNIKHLGIHNFSKNELKKK